jgi:hypothetical protein
MGAGTIGLLAALVLRLRGLDVTVFGRTERPYLNSDLLEELGARYESTVTSPILGESCRRHGPFDLIFEATGASAVVFESMRALARNGVLVLSSVTGGDKMIEVPADRINLEFVLGNKVMVGTVNANREYFEMGVKDLAHAESQYPGWLGRLLTHPVKGLENWKLLLDTLTGAQSRCTVRSRRTEDDLDDRRGTHAGPAGHFAIPGTPAQGGAAPPSIRGVLSWRESGRMDGCCGTGRHRPRRPPAPRKCGSHPGASARGSSLRFSGRRGSG